MVVYVENPLTGFAIKEGGPTYKDLEAKGYPVREFRKVKKGHRPLNSHRSPRSPRRTGGCGCGSRSPARPGTLRSRVRVSSLSPLSPRRGVNHMGRRMSPRRGMNHMDRRGMNHMDRRGMNHMDRRGMTRRVSPRRSLSPRRVARRSRNARRATGWDSALGTDVSYSPKKNYRW